MKFRTLMLTAVTIFVAFVSVPSVPAATNCQKVKGTEYSFFTGPTTVEGYVTRGGILNGKTQAILTSDFLPTPDPTTISFTTDISFFTENGIILTHSPHILDLASGAGTAFARIDPAGSTGSFAGATGLLFINFKQIEGGTAAQADITGEICYAN